MINAFTGEHRWLSNFCLVTVRYEGISFPSTEHAFQAAKTTDLAERRRIAALAQPSDAKKAGRALKLRPDWESVKLSVMEELLHEKFRHPHLREALIATGNEQLVEGNWWGDTFWGVCRNVGQNNLGKLLMKIRKELSHAGEGHLSGGVQENEGQDGGADRGSA